MVKYVALNSEGRKLYKVTAKRIVEQESTLSIVTAINGNEMHFKLNGLKNSEEIDVALDKILPVIEKQLSNEDTNQIYIANFDKDLHEWATKNFLEEVRKKGDL